MVSFLLRFKGLGFRVYRGYIGTMENKMESTIMENQMKNKWKMKWKQDL